MIMESLLTLANGHEVRESDAKRDEPTVVDIAHKMATTRTVLFDTCILGQRKLHDAFPREYISVECL